jgi:hypothetical protein
MQRTKPASVEHGSRRRRDGDARDHAAQAPGEVGHAGGAVVDHDPGAFHRPQGGQAGVGTGEDLDPGFPKRGVNPVALVRGVEGGDVEAPAGQRLGIAMDHADRRTADTIATQHRKLAEPPQQFGMGLRGLFQAGMDAVRALHGAGIDILGIGAAAACTIVR